jgi:hypothetical protein
MVGLVGYYECWLVDAYECFERIRGLRCRPTVCRFGTVDLDV